ncbi:MAG: hypothetical protein U9R08_05405 [Nanoarchaeota archaeon]|nr:hypothetical protein [Nanoarchaeota archaeon]
METRTDLNVLSKELEQQIPEGLRLIRDFYFGQQIIDESRKELKND